MPIEFIPSFTRATWNGTGHGYEFDAPVTVNYRQQLSLEFRCMGLSLDLLTDALARILWLNHVHYYVVDTTNSITTFSIIQVWHKSVYNKVPEFEPGDEAEENDQTQIAQGA